MLVNPVAGLTHTKSVAIFSTDLVALVFLTCFGFSSTTGVGGTTGEAFTLVVVFLLVVQARVDVFVFVGACLEDDFGARCFVVAALLATVVLVVFRAVVFLATFIVFAVVLVLLSLTVFLLVEARTIVNPQKWGRNGPSRIGILGFKIRGFAVKLTFLQSV